MLIYYYKIVSLKRWRSTLLSTGMKTIAFAQCKNPRACDRKIILWLQKAFSEIVLRFGSVTNIIKPACLCADTIYDGNRSGCSGCLLHQFSHPSTAGARPRYTTFLQNDSRLASTSNELSKCVLNFKYQFALVHGKYSKRTYNTIY